MKARLRSGVQGLAVFAVLAIVFTTWPQLDLWASRQFLHVDGSFTGNDHAAVRFLYRVVPIVGWTYFIGSIVAVILGRVRPAWVGMRWRHRAAAMVMVSALGSALMINGVLKEHWGRARPVQVSEFGGPQHFTPALLPASECAHNCSFVSGHSASGFVLMAFGLVGPVATRRRWWLAGLAAGAVASLGRVMQGGHFLSDTLFSGWTIWACGWVVRELWLRWVALRVRRVRRGRLGGVRG